MSAMDYQILVYKSSVTSTQIAAVSTGSVVDFVLGSSDLMEPPITVTPSVDPLSGRVESRPWNARVVDASSAMTARLADSSGHAQLLQRYAIARRDTTGNWVPIGAGRIASVELDENVAAYNLGFVDEMGFARDTRVFVTNDTRIFPPGHVDDWGGYLADQNAYLPNQGNFGSVLEAAVVYTPFFSVNLWKVSWGQNGLRWGLQDRGRELIIDDLINRQPTLGSQSARLQIGSFRDLRMRVEGSDSTDYLVVGFGSLLGVAPHPNPVLALEENGMNGRDNEMICWFTASSGILPGNASSGSFDCYLHMMGREPSEDLPLHLGGRDGIHDAQLLLNLYEGTYSTAGAPLPYISTAAWSGSTGLLALSRVPRVYRITESGNLGAWTEDNIFGPGQIYGFVDGRGLIAPRDAALPADPVDWSSTGMFTFTGANCIDPHPSFSHVREQLFTVVNLPYDLWIEGYTRESSTYNNDLVRVFPRNELLESTRGTAQSRGRFVYDPPFRPGFTGVQLSNGSNFDMWAEGWKRDFFDRFEDGAIGGEIHTLAGSSLLPGGFVNINLETYPTLNTQTRGGTRTVQLTAKEVYPDRYVYSYLDGGPALQALNAPTIALTTFAAGNIDPHHSLKVNVGAISSQGAGYDLQIANSATLPGASAAAWRPQGLFITDGIAHNTTPTLSNLPSGSTWWARARATKSHRVRSAWTNSTKKATQAMGAPTNINVATSQINAPEATVSWSVSTSTALGADQYRPLTVHWDPSSVAPISSTNPNIVTLPAGSLQYTMTNLAANSTYTVGVRLFDRTLPYLNTSSMGGVGPSDSTTFETSGATLTCTTVKSLSVTWGTL